MTTDQLLAALKARGLTVKAGKGGPVLVGNPALVTEKLRRVLKWHREEILRRLDLPDSEQPPAREVVRPEPPPEAVPVALDAAGRPCDPDGPGVAAWQCERKIETVFRDGKKWWRWVGEDGWRWVKHQPAPTL